MEGRGLVDRELFNAALSWEAYLESMTSNYRLLLQKLSEFRLPPHEEDFWSRFDRPLNILVLTEDWCQTSVTALPPLVSIAKIAPTITLRVFRLSEVLDLARALLEDEYPPIPVFLLYDESFTELGRFVEQPATWDEVMADPEQRAWLRSDPQFYDALWADLELDQLRTIVGG